jgi:hypothetical protein
MADIQRIYWDVEGYAHTACLHWEGFLKILWDTLRIFHYRYPPQYKGCEFTEVRVPRCRATITVPQHPILEWQSIEIEVVRYRLGILLKQQPSRLSPLFVNNIQWR